MGRSFGDVVLTEAAWSVPLDAGRAHPWACDVGVPGGTPGAQPEHRRRGVGWRRRGDAKVRRGAPELGVCGRVASGMGSGARSVPHRNRLAGASAPSRSRRRTTRSRWSVWVRTPA